MQNLTILFWKKKSFVDYVMFMRDNAPGPPHFIVLQVTVGTRSHYQYLSIPCPGDPPSNWRKKQRCTPHSMHVEHLLLTSFPDHQWGCWTWNETYRHVLQKECATLLVLWGAILAVHTWLHVTYIPVVHSQGRTRSVCT